MIRDRTNESKRQAVAAENIGGRDGALATQHATVGVWFWDAEFDRVWANPHCRTLLNVGDGQLELDGFLMRLSGAQRQSVKAMMFDAIRGMTAFRSEFEIKRDNRTSTWLLADAQSVQADSGPGLAGTLFNITESKALQHETEQLRRQIIHLTRVSTLGELSGAVAHELNQPLTAILSNAQAGQRLINRNEASIAEISSILEDIIEDDRRAGAVLTRLRNLIRNENVDFSEFDINEVVGEVLRLVNSELIERRVEIAVERAPVLPPVRGDRIQIQQVLINLVRNACDAMAAVRWAPHQMTVRTARRSDGGIAVTVSDNGAGVPVDLRDNLFDPFVTTKSKGMGLGLTISRAIISSHHGEIWYEDNPGGGSVFGFSLPSAQRSSTWTS